MQMDLLKLWGDMPASVALKSTFWVTGSSVAGTITVKYKGVIVGDYVADLIVDEKVIVELKTEEKYNKQHEAQLLNELKATGTKVGLLVNFGREGCEFKRMVM